MNSLIEWFAKNGVAANIMAMFIVVVGFLSIGTLRQEVFPEFSSDMIYITVPYPGAAPEEVEEGACQKIEEAVYGLTDVKQVNSTSTENAAAIMVELSGSSIDAKVDEMNKRVRSFGAMGASPSGLVGVVITKSPRVRLPAAPAEGTGRRLQTPIRCPGQDRTRARLEPQAR